jgi:hypothetical protein
MGSVHGKQKTPLTFRQAGLENLWFAWLDWPLPADFVVLAGDVPGNAATSRVNDNARDGGHRNEANELSRCHAAPILRQSSAKVKPSAWIRDRSGARHNSSLPHTHQTAG